MAHAMPIPTSDPDLAVLLQAYNDVTERLKQSHEVLAREVHRLRDELKEKDRELQRRQRLASLGQMAAGVAHEIRNPLGGIQLFASVLERDLCDRPKQQRIARKIGAGVATVESIVRDILAFAGGADPTIADASCRDIVGLVVEQVTSRARAAGVTVVVPNLDAELVVRCDARLIDRALSNLVFNAIDAASRGGHVWIEVEASPGASATVEFVVSDDGVGIDPHRAQEIFNPFYTTKENGTGLGLAIVHGIVEAHGGMVRVQTRRGGGTSFVIALPSQVAIRDHSDVMTRVA